MVQRLIVKNPDMGRLDLVKSIIEIAKKLQFHNPVCIMCRYNGQ